MTSLLSLPSCDELSKEFNDIWYFKIYSSDSTWTHFKNKDGIDGTLGEIYSLLNRGI